MRSSCDKDRRDLDFTNWGCLGDDSRLCEKDLDFCGIVSLWAAARFSSSSSRRDLDFTNLDRRGDSCGGEEKDFGFSWTVESERMVDVLVVVVLTVDFDFFFLLLRDRFEGFRFGMDFGFRGEISSSS